MMLTKLRNWFTHSMAIDLGTVNTLVFVKGEGIVLQEPSVVALRRNGDRNEKKIIAIGQKAKEMLEKTPQTVEAIRPIRDSIISDFERAGEMLRYFIMKAERHHSLFRPRVLIGVPFGITKVEQRAVRESALAAGARDVHLVSDPMASAIGAGLPVNEAMGSMIVDIGGGTTEVAVISLGNIILSKSIPIAGDHIDEAIVHHVKQKHNLNIGHATAEHIKREIGSCYPAQHPKKMDIRGLDLISRLPKSIEINSKEIWESIADPVHAIVDIIKSVLEHTPPELSADIIDSGVTLSGGGSLLPDLDTLIHKETGLQIKYAENPLSSVVLGSGKMLDSIDMIPSETDVNG